jgi:hypothetical protein
MQIVKRVSYWEKRKRSQSTYFSRNLALHFFYHAAIRKATSFRALYHSWVLLLLATEIEAIPIPLALELIPTAITSSAVLLPADHA